MEEEGRRRSRKIVRGEGRSRGRKEGKRRGRKEEGEKPGVEGRTRVEEET